MMDSGFRTGLRALRNAAFGLAIVASVGFVATGSAQDRGVVVFAAASLKNALDEVAGTWEARTGRGVTVSYAASSALAKQIAQGAPADIFISADLDWMDELATESMIRAESRRDLLGNRLVLVAPADSQTRLEIAEGMDMEAALGGGKLAMADTTAVPAGKYGKAALESLGVWDTVQDDVAQAENVRAALALVSRGEAPLGIVYATDAAADAGVKVLGMFPGDTHPPIVYPAALTAASANPHAEDLITFIGSDEAGLVFAKHGFVPLD